jgi:dynein heavy chain
MRAVKSIVTAAGSLNRQFPDEDEDQIVLRAISDCNIPKFLSGDIPLFKGIIKDLFPTIDLKTPDYNILEVGIKRSMK